MKDFNKIVKEFEQIDAITYADVLAEKASNILPVLVNFSTDGISGIELSTFACFLR